MDDFESERTTNNHVTFLFECLVYSHSAALRDLIGDNKCLLLPSVYLYKKKKIIINITSKICRHEKNFIQEILCLLITKWKRCFLIFYVWEFMWDKICYYVDFAIWLQRLFCPLVRNENYVSKFFSRWSTHFFDLKSTWPLFIC